MMMMRSVVRSCLRWCLLAAVLDVSAGSVVCPAAPPVQGAAVRGATPVFPADNWWNLDVRSAPVDANSAAFISFINNGGTRRLHPDFGGEESPNSVAIYGFPYAVVDGSQVKSAVAFQYWDESDGVDPATGTPLPFYPIPSQAITQAHWVEGGAPANVDQRSSSDRHLLMVDCSNNHLYELYNVWYDASKGRWFGGSGAFFDMNTNARRPDGWTSADAAGLAVFPGLVRYDEVYDPAVTEIGHALRVTVRATNGYVWPASHRAGTTAGALPMGARLRLKASVGGLDPALRSNDPQMQKIFRAMQRHGLIVADNGSDLYISGSFDTRWNNDILNPAFSLLSASDFEVIQLGWNPVGTAPALGGLGLQPTSVVGGSGATGNVSLTAPAPAAGAVVALASSNAAAMLPSTVAVPAGASSASFAITTSPVATLTSAVITASWGGASKQATLTLQPAVAPTLSSLALAPARVKGGQAATGTVTLSAAAPTGGATVALRSSAAGVASVPASVVVPAGARTASFVVTTAKVTRNTTVTISATWQSRTVSSALIVTRR